MNKSKLLLLAFVFSCVFSITLDAKAQSNGGAKPQPPMTEKKPKTTTIHGVTIVDDYFWLREKTNPAVILLRGLFCIYANTTILYAQQHFHWIIKRTNIFL